MRYALCLLMISSVLLVACGGGGDDGDSNNGDGNSDNVTSGLSGEELLATVQAEEALSEDDNSGDNPLPTLIPEASNTPLVGETTGIDVTIEPDDIPPVGVIGEVATEDPSPGEVQETRTDFDYIYFQQTRLADEFEDRESVVIEVFGDGRVVVDSNEESTTIVSQAELDAVAQQINDLNFFNIPSTFLSGVPQPEGTYRYRIAVVRGTLERAIQAEDIATPVELRQLFASVQSLANPVFNPFDEPSATEVGN